MDGGEDAVESIDVEEEGEERKEKEVSVNVEEKREMLSHSDIDWGLEQESYRD